MIQEKCPFLSGVHRIFFSLVNDGFPLQELFIHGNLKKEGLDWCLFDDEQQLSLIKESIPHTSEGKDAGLIFIKQAIPCMMHKENRVGEKLIDRNWSFFIKAKESF